MGRLNGGKLKFLCKIKNNIFSTTVWDELPERQTPFSPRHTFFSYHTFENGSRLTHKTTGKTMCMLSSMFF